MTESADKKKGRPTPKRKEAEAARKVSSLAPASTKEEKKRAKEALLRLSLVVGEAP